jgi:hypothetical protein
MNLPEKQSSPNFETESNSNFETSSEGAYLGRAKLMIRRFKARTLSARKAEVPAQILHAIGRLESEGARQ